VPFLINEYDYYYGDDDDLKSSVTQTPETTASGFRPSPGWPLINRGRERFTAADVYVPRTTTWAPPIFGGFDSETTSKPYVHHERAKLRYFKNIFVQLLKILFSRAFRTRPFHRTQTQTQTEVRNSDSGSDLRNRDFPAP
jgi:hypothetical protein